VIFTVLQHERRYRGADERYLAGRAALVAVPIEPLVGIVSLCRSCAAGHCLRHREDATPIAEESSERQNVRPGRVSPPAPPTMATSVRGLNEVLDAALPDPAFIESSTVIDAEHARPRLAPEPRWRS